MSEMVESLRSDEKTTRRDPPGASTVHAVVAGGGCAALCAAHALSRHFDRVTVLDDRAPGARAVPGGAPAWLSARARLELEWLVPGISERLCGEGGRIFHVRPPRTRTGNGSRCRAADGAIDGSALHGIECTSDRFFRVLGRLVAERPNVAIVHRTRVEELVGCGGSFGRVSGARVSRGSADRAWPRQQLEIDANVIVDATGPESRLLAQIADVTGDSTDWTLDSVEVAKDAVALRRRMDGCGALPDGYLPVGSTVLGAPGDLAVRATLAALSARALEESLAVAKPGEPGFTADFVRAQTRRHAHVWQWLEDLGAMRAAARPDSLGTPRGRYLLAFRRRARHDTELAGLLARIDQHLDPPDRAFEPRIVWRVVRAAASLRMPLRSTG